MLVAFLITAVPVVSPQEMTWIDRLELSGDGRVRWESTFNPPGGGEDRHRGRLRFRLGARYELTDQLLAGARFTTLSDGNDANNVHWDFGDGGDGFSGGGVGIDRFWIDYRPHRDLSLLAGKMPHVFDLPPFARQFAWDTDVQPAGLAAVLRAPGEDFHADLRLAAYTAVESSADHEPKMAGVQGNLGGRIDGETTYRFSSSFSSWTDLEFADASLDNQGNTDVTANVSLWDSFLHVSTRKGPFHGAQGYVQYLRNGDAERENAGFVLGAAVGQRTHPGDVQVYGAWYDLDADSVFTPVAQDDTPVAGTGLGRGMKGAIVGVRWVWKEDVSFRFWLLTSDLPGVEDDAYRIRLDLDFQLR